MKVSQNYTIYDTNHSIRYDSHALQCKSSVLMEMVKNHANHDTSRAIHDSTIEREKKIVLCEVK
jgi:hypothetical protein